MAKSSWDKTTARVRRFIYTRKAQRDAQKKLCERCVWPNRLTGVMNCPFPRCVEGKWPQM